MARPDQALSFHHVGGFRYELSGLRTGSVRDQILRAQLLVERLLARNDLSDDPLLVIGGGAAGVTAALTASRLGRDVTLLEAQLSPFQTQARVTTRWLDPTEFDWPQPHWTTADMAWAGLVYRLPGGLRQGAGTRSEADLLLVKMPGPDARDPQCRRPSVAIRSEAKLDST